MFLSSKKSNTNKLMVAELDAMLHGISQGDQSSFEQFYLHTRSSVYSFALSILKNSLDAEDVLHECYVVVWNNAANYHSGRIRSSFEFAQFIIPSLNFFKEVDSL